MNKLRIKANINCETCGCSLRRIKTIKVISSTEEGAKEEVKCAIEAWKLSLAGQNCKFCQSIINDLKK